MIVREANVLKRSGFVKAASLLYSVAQSPGQAGQAATGTGDAGAMPPASPPADPSGAGNPGAPGGLPATVPGVPDANTPVGQDQNAQPPAAAIMGGGNAPAGTPASAPPVVPQGPPQPKGIKEFILNMNEGNKTDTTKADDDLDIIDELHVSDQEEELMVTEAQALPPVPPGPPAAALEDVPITDNPKPERNPPAFIPPAADKPEKEKGPADAEEPLEVTEDDIGKPQDTLPATSVFNDKVDALMKNVTIADVVSELEDISKAYKTREQPRRLGYVDMMLDSLGLASLFPSLSEAQNKALEANNYISTRVDDILAKLRGAMASAEKSTVPTPEREDMAGIKGKLQGDQEKELKRKQMRKEQEAVDLEGGAGKETPEVEMGELGAPAPAAPPAPPAVPARGPAPRPLG
jgi:hypothetical protein